MITRKEHAAAAAAYNESQSAELRTRALSRQETATAQTEWVWTKEAELQSDGRQRAGAPVWPQWTKTIPKFNVDRGLVIDKSEYINVKEGQSDLFDFL
ncbi:hypothetical protein [Paenibacillus campi]|uniref:hypothetical protein n=1 Tax=Paenibacillus campi TaxID=3106031 RepID=UPI002AFFCB60|nr:hypothetical protein [Paenibacillus sp. SGZ-1014]